MLQLLDFMQQENPKKITQIEDYMNVQDAEHLILNLGTEEYRSAKERNVQSKELQLYVYQPMQPYFMQYSHTNYTRWGEMCINEMH